jgi:hypothetical protein
MLIESHMLENRRNHLYILDAGDNLGRPATSNAAPDLDTEHALQPPCPAHRDVLRHYATIG